MLNPSFKNIQGNTIVHQILKVPFSSMALDVVILISSYIIGANLYDNDGSLKKLCTKLGATDRRVEYIKSILQLHSDLSTKENENVELSENTSPKGSAPVCDSEIKNQQNKKSKHYNDGIRVAEVRIDKSLTINECLDFIKKHINKMECCKYDLSCTHNTEADNQCNTDEKFGQVENNENYKLNADELAVEEELNAEIIEPITDKIDKAFNTSIFDGLEWEVECTEKVWKWLSKKKMLKNLKDKLVQQIRQLACGDWSTVVHKRLEHIPKGIYLFETKLSKAARIIWQVAISFSERSSYSTLTTSKNNSEVNGGIYTEVIRVWDVVLNHDHLSATIERIVKSISRGRQCMLHKNLRKQTSIMVSDKQPTKKLPHFWVEAFINENNSLQDKVYKLYPPGSADDREYHIVKFYSFNSQLISSLLQNQVNVKVEFPFRVTELEHAIINLKHTPPAPVILLGRSGTGKTTCCLYRLWNRCINYWTLAKSGGPLMPRGIEFKSKGKNTVFLLLIVLN